MADLSLFQQLAASCATMLPLLGKEEQEEARKMVTRMLIKEDKIHFHHEDLKVEQSEVNDKEKMIEITMNMVMVMLITPPRSQDRRWPWGSDGLSPTEAPTSPQLPRCGSPGR